MALDIVRFTVSNDAASVVGFFNHVAEGHDPEEYEVVNDDEHEYTINKLSDSFSRYKGEHYRFEEVLSRDEEVSVFELRTERLTQQDVMDFQGMTVSNAGNSGMKHVELTRGGWIKGMADGKDYPAYKDASLG